MKISRTLLSYAGVLGFMSLSQVALGQTAPAAPAPAPAVPATEASVAAPKATGDASLGTGMSSSSSLGLGAAAPAPLEPAPLAAVEPAPVEKPTEKADANPKKLAIAKEGWLQLGVLAQAWYVFEQGKELMKDADMDRFVDNRNYFRIRRAQLKLSGTIVPGRVDFLILADFAKALRGSSFSKPNTNPTPGYYQSGQDSSPLLDFMITIKSDYADFSMGQWKSPISYEAGTSSADLILPERSYAARYFGDNYDLGAKVEKKFEYVKYSAQVLQGGTANTIDSNKQKDLALRLEFYPIKGLFVGGAGLASVGQRTTQTTTREIIEADAGYDKDGILVRGEMLWGKQGAVVDGKERTKSNGMSLSAAYTIAKQFQPTFRIGYLNIDQTINPAKLPLQAKFDLKTDEVRSYEFGFNYMLEGKHAKLMAAYGYYDFDSKFMKPRHQAMLAAQAAF